MAGLRYTTYIACPNGGHVLHLDVSNHIRIPLEYCTFGETYTQCPTCNTAVNTGLKEWKELSIYNKSFILIRNLFFYAGSSLIIGFVLSIVATMAFDLPNKEGASQSIKIFGPMILIFLVCTFRLLNRIRKSNKRFFSKREND